MQEISTRLATKRRSNDPLQLIRNEYGNIKLNKDSERGSERSSDDEADKKDGLNYKVTEMKDEELDDGKSSDRYSGITKSPAVKITNAIR